MSGRHRRHNRHFNLDDDLTRCSGKTAYKDYQCSNWGKPDEDGRYWCHHHRSQKNPETVREETGE